MILSIARQRGERTVPNRVFHAVDARPYPPKPRVMNCIQLAVPLAQRIFDGLQLLVSLRQSVLDGGPLFHLLTLDGGPIFRLLTPSAFQFPSQSLKLDLGRL